MANWKSANILLRPIIYEPDRPEGFLLAPKLAEAMNVKISGEKVKESWALRQYSYDETDVIVMNVLSSSSTEFYCQFARIEKDGLLPTANTKSGNGGNLRIDQIKTPDGHDPCKATSLFFVSGNQSLFIDSGIRTSTVEKYLTWLFNERCALAKELVIKLAAKFELLNGQKSKMDVTEISIKPQGVHVPTPLEQQISERTETKDVGSLSVPEKIFEILKILGVGYSTYEKIQREAGGDALIELALNIKVRQKRSLVSLQKVDFENIAREFGDDEVQLRGRDGRLAGKMASVKYPARITCQGSILDSRDALTAIKAAWQHFVAQGYIR